MNIFFGVLIVFIGVGFIGWMIYLKTRNVRENQIIQYYPNGALKTISNYYGKHLLNKEHFDEKSEFKRVYKFNRYSIPEYHYCLEHNPGEDNYYAYTDYIYSGTGTLKYNFRDGLFPSSLLELFTSYDKAKSIEVLEDDSAFYRFINAELKENTSFILSALNLNGEIIAEIEDGLIDVDLIITALSSKKPYLDSRIFDYFEEMKDNISSQFDINYNKLKNAFLTYLFTPDYDEEFPFISDILNDRIPQEIKVEFVERCINLNDVDFFNITESISRVFYIRQFYWLENSYVDKRGDFIFKNKFILKRQFEIWKNRELRLFFEKNIEIINNGKEYIFHKLNRYKSLIGYLIYMVFYTISVLITIWLTYLTWLYNHLWVLILESLFAGLFTYVMIEFKIPPFNFLDSIFISKKKVLKKLCKQFSNNMEILDMLSGGENTAYMIQYVDPSLLKNNNFQLEAQRVNGKIFEFYPEILHLSDTNIYHTINDIGLSMLTDDDLIEIQYVVKVLRGINPNLSDSLKERIEKLTNDLEFMSKKVSENGNFITIACQELLDNEEFCLKAISENANAFEFVSDRLKDNEFIVRAAVEKDGFAIQFASNRLQNNKEIALIAVQQDIYSFQVLTALCKTELEILEFVFKEDKDFVISCINAKESIKIIKKYRSKPDYVEDDDHTKFGSKVGEIIFADEIESFFQNLYSGYYNDIGLDEIPSGYENDKTVVLKSVGINGLLLEQASAHLKEDFDVVLAAVSENGLAVQFASRSLLKNSEIIKQALGNNGCALEFVECNEYKILKDAVSSNPNSIRLINAEDFDLYYLSSFRGQKLVKMSLANDYGFNLKYAPKYYKDKTSIVKLALANNGSLEHASLRLRNNKRMVKYAIEHNPANFQFASIRLRRKKDLVKWCVEKDFNSFKFASFQLRSDLEFVKSLIQIDWRVIVHASIPILNDSEVIKYAFSKYKEKDFLEIVSELIC